MKEQTEKVREREKKKKKKKKVKEKADIAYWISIRFTGAS